MRISFTTVLLLCLFSVNASPNPTFALDGQLYQIEVEGENYYSINDQENRVFQAFAEMAGPGMLSLLVLFEESSWRALQSGDRAGLKEYVTVAAQSETIGRVRNFDFQRLVEEIESTVESGAAPQLTGPAAQMGFSISSYQNAGIFRQEENVVASASSTTYVDRSGEIAQQATIATLFFKVDDAILNVVVARPSASKEDLERVKDVASRVRIQATSN